MPNAVLLDPSIYPDTLDACRAERIRICDYIREATDYGTPETILDDLNTATTRLFGLMLHERYLKTGSYHQA
jgi:hypothetical protein